MNHPDHPPKASCSSTGLFATLRAYLRLRGSGATAADRRRGKRALSMGLGSAAAALGLLLPAAPASATLTHFPQPDLPFSDTHDPTGLAVDQANHLVYVAEASEPSNHSVLREVNKYDTSGNEQNFSAISSPHLLLPDAGLNGLAVDSSGDIYVADASSRVVRKYLPTGAKGTPEEMGSGVLTSPLGIAVNSSGDVYVTTIVVEGNGMEKETLIDEFSPTGALENTFGGGLLHGARDLAIDSEGNLIVSAGNGTFAFDAGGNCLNSCNPIDSGAGGAVAVDPTTDHVYVADQEQAKQRSDIVEYDSAAHGFAELGSFTSGELTNFVDAIAIDGSSGDVYVADLNPQPSGRIYVFGPDVVIPTLHITPVSNLQQSSVTLGATVSTAGTEAADALTDCHFAYVTEEAFEATGFADLSSGGEAPCSPAAASIPDDGNDHAVSAAISGLSPRTAYRFRLIAANHNDESQPEHIEGGSFTTAGAPMIDLQYMDGIEKTAATLHAKVNPFEFETHAHFEYISAADYQANGESFSGAHPATSTASQALGSGLGDVPLAQPLTGLQPGTTYHFRAVATNAAGTVDGPDREFTTTAPALFALQSPTGLTTTAATLHVYIDPLGLATSYHFEYGTTTSYGQSTEPAAAGSGSAFALQSAALAGLSPGTEYHFRAVATNSAGTATSPDFAFTTPPTGCPNEALREENASTALPDCRAFEMVSPAVKAGSGMDVQVPAPSGERVLYSGKGSFAGDNSGALRPTYLARRGSDGWTTEPLLDFPQSLGKYLHNSLAAATPDLTQSITEPVTAGARNAGEADSGDSGTLYRRGPDGLFAPASPPLITSDSSDLFSAWVSGQGLVGADSDLSHLVLRTGAPLLPSAPSLEEGKHLYEVIGADTDSPSLQILNRDSSGEEIAPCSPGAAAALGAAGEGPAGFQHHEVSEDGSAVFFTIESASLAGGCDGAAHLLARLNGQTTVDISDPQPNAECTSSTCRGAPISNPSFQGASADGSIVFFTSAQQLTDSASEDAPDSIANRGLNRSGCQIAIGPNGCNLYVYNFSRPPGQNLMALSAGDSSGGGPQVRTVLAASADGSKVYFIARGLLSDQPNSLGQTAHAGAENIYLADTATAGLTFVGDLCTGVERSGTFAGDTQCPGSGIDSSSPVDLTPDGRFLLLTTYAQLTPDDTNQAADVYRFDAQTDTILRVSIGHNGEDENGNGGGQDASARSQPFETEATAVESHAISSDGSTIVFATARPLQASAESGLPTAYEWHQGQVTLVSGGKATHGVTTATVDPSGRDITFITDQSLLPADTDGLGDVYDARAGGGFPLTPPPPPICEGPEGCGRQAGPEPPPPTFGSGSLEHGPEVPVNPCRKGFVRRHGKCVKKHHRAHHKRRHHGRAANSNRGGAK